MEKFNVIKIEDMNKDQLRAVSSFIYTMTEHGSKGELNSVDAVIDYLEVCTDKIVELLTK